MIAENLAHVRKSIAETCRASGRDPESVRLIAVSKTFGASSIREAQQAGQQDFGENYAQELREKKGLIIDSPVRWHFIGHLQSNKVKYIIEAVHTVHTVDSVGLGEEIQKRAARLDRFVDILIEVHTTHEQTKSGIRQEEAIEFAGKLGAFPNLRLRGLMTMGPLAEDPETARPSYRILRELLERGKSAGLAWSELSMGMTHDYRVAIQEGATMVRVGTGIFGERISG